MYFRGDRTLTLDADIQLTTPSLNWPSQPNRGALYSPSNIQLFHHRFVGDCWLPAVIVVVWWHLFVFSVFPISLVAFSSVPNTLCSYGTASSSSSPKLPKYDERKMTDSFPSSSSYKTTTNQLLLPSMFESSTHHNNDNTGVDHDVVVADRSKTDSVSAPTSVKRIKADNNEKADNNNSSNSNRKQLSSSPETERLLLPQQTPIAKYLFSRLLVVVRMMPLLSHPNDKDIFIGTIISWALPF
jgi:hypothetical protein